MSRYIFVVALFLLLGSSNVPNAAGIQAQSKTGTLLVVEVANAARYNRDVSDYSLLASNPGPLNAAVPRNFTESVVIGDIVSVNGRPTKGTGVEILSQVRMSPDAAPGQALADITRANFVQHYFEILNDNGRPIGSLLVSGMSQGIPQPGQTRQIAGGSWVVLGGNGAFLGARGYMGGMPGEGAAGSVRGTSVAEDPANRRQNGGGTLRWGIYILPMFRPEIEMVDGEPDILHSSDSSLVTVAKPAKPGEMLTLFASGLGPTSPGVEPGHPFSADPVQVCNSPIEVLVNGKSSEVLYAAGYPGSVDRYQIKFRVPDGTASGLASIQLSSAWIKGAEVRLPIQ